MVTGFMARPESDHSLWVPGTELRSYAVSPYDSVTPCLALMTVADTFPTSLSGIAWSCDETGGGVCGNPSGSGDIGETVDLPVGTSVTFTAQGTVGSGALQGISNTATVTCPSGVIEREPSDNSATDTNVGWGILIFADGFEDGTIDAWL